MRIDPCKNMHRFYEVHVQSTLFDQHSVVCTWGSTKSRYHRMRTIKTDTKEAAEKLANQIIIRKSRKGYK